MPISSINTSPTRLAIGSAFVALSLWLGSASTLHAAGVESPALDRFYSNVSYDALRYAPDDAVSLLSVRFELLNDSEALRELQRTSPWFVSLIERVELEALTGVKDVARVTLGGRAGEQPILVVEFHKDVAAERRLETRLSGDAYRRESIDGVTLFAPQGRLSAWRSAYFQPDPKTLVVGPARLLAEVLARSGPAILAPQFQETAERLDYSQPLTMAIDAANARESLKVYGPVAELLEPFGAIGVSCGLGRDATVNARLRCDDAETARDVRLSLRMIRGLAMHTSALESRSSSLVERLAVDGDASEVVVNWSLSRDRLLGLISESPRRSEDDAATEL